MNFTDYRISLDIHNISSQVAIPVKKGDTKRRLCVSLAENGKPYHITDDCYAVFTAKKPDGAIVYNDCIVKGNTIFYLLTPQTTAVFGAVDCEIRLYGQDDALITSPKFTLIVDDTVYSDGDVIESSSEYSALTNLVSQCQELLNNGIHGEYSVEDLPVGMSYAEGNVSLSYLVDGEKGVYHTLAVETGSCIFKTIGQITDNGSDETVDGAITVYVIPRNQRASDDYGNQSTVIMKKITPFHDMYGLQYSYSEIANKIEIADSIPDDPDYAAVYPNHVPSVKAVIDYVDKNAGGSVASATPIYRDTNISDIDAGVYFAANNINLIFVTDNEINATDSLFVNSGSVFVKTFGQINNEGTGEIVNGAGFVYIFPSIQKYFDDFRNKTTLIMQKIEPFANWYGTQYRLTDDIKFDIEVAKKIPDDPVSADDYANIHPNYVPNVRAMIDYVSKNAGDGSGSADWKLLHTQNGEATRYDETTPLEVTGFSCKELRGMFNVKGGWDAVPNDMRYVYLNINDTRLRITDFCGEATSDALDVLFDISQISYAGARYLKIVLTITPNPDYIDDGYGMEPQTQQYIFLKDFTDEAITTFKISSNYTYDYDQYYYNHTTKLELEGR